MLDLTDASISAALLLAICNNLEQLREINISHCINVTDASITALVTQCKKLTTLWVCGNDITDASLQAIATCGHCGQRLTSLGISTCRQLSTAAVITVLQCCTMLSTLFVGDVLYRDDGNKLVAHLPGLLRHLLFAARPTNAVLSAIALRCPLLQHLDLRYDGRYTAQGITTCARSCRSLTTLTLPNVLWYIVPRSEALLAMDRLNLKVIHVRYLRDPCLLGNS